jgi:hypothetical protein
MSERTSYFLPGIALIFIGFATGWFLQGARQGVKPKRLLPAPPTKTSRIDEGLRIAIDELVAVTDPGARYEAVERIPPGEMRAYLHGLRNRAGLRGLNNRDRELLSTMLAVWHARDANDLLTWILAHEDEASRINLLYRMFESAELTDPPGAMKLAVAQMISGDGRFEIPAGILQAALRDGPDTLLACLRLAVHPTAIGQDLEIEFPANFDFAGFAAGLAGHLSQLPEGMHQLVLPMNLAEAWAGTDPVAAFFWAGHHPEAATPQGVRASINVIAGSPPRQAGAIFAQAMQVEESDPGLVIAGLAKALHSEPNPQILAHFLDAFESLEVQEDYLVALFQGTVGPEPARHSPRVRHLVLSGMTADERLAFLDGILRTDGTSPESFQVDVRFDESMREELARLNHPEDEITAIMEHLASATVTSTP